jgi:2-haloacid dehalogenase
MTKTPSAAVDFSRFEALTFDCYGALIDWDSGIVAAVRTAFSGLAKSDAEILKAYSEIEPQIQSGGYQPYRTILRGVLAELGRRFGRNPASSDAFAESLPLWKPFPDTVPALRALGQRFRLAIISKIDDDLFAGTARALEVPFDAVVTAQQVGS